MRIVLSNCQIKKAGLRKKHKLCLIWCSRNTSSTNLWTYSRLLQSGGSGRVLNIGCRSEQETEHMLDDNV